MSVVNDLGIILSESDAVHFGESLFLNFFPELPGNVTSIHVTGGLPAVYTHSSSSPAMISTRVQVLVRDVDPVDGLEKANDIYNTLSAVSNYSVAGTFYLGIYPLSVPTLVERDKDGRSLFAVNFLVKQRN